MSEKIKSIIADSIAVKGKVLNDDRIIGTVEKIVDQMVSALRNKNRIYFCGNGGSAGDAQHFVTELVGRFEQKRQALAAVALTADSSVMTAVANDYGYDHVFVRQVEALGVAGDVLLGISTSGRSPNVERAMVAARARGLVTIALTGRDGGTIAGLSDIVVNVADESTARAQEVHRTILHAICLLVEQGLAPN